MNLEEIIAFLKNLGLKVDPKTYLVSSSESLLIRGGVLLEDTRYHEPWVVYLDHAECFDKWRKCPIHARCSQSYAADFPAKLETAIKFLATPEGFELSNSYDFYDNPIWDIPK